jgi:hypothetical protein
MHEKKPDAIRIGRLYSKIDVFCVPHLFTCKSPNNLVVHAETELLIKRRRQHLKAKAFFINEFPPGPRVSYWGLLELLRKFAAIFKSTGLTPAINEKIVETGSFYIFS